MSHSEVSRVLDVMRQPDVTIRPETTFKEAVAEMITYKTNGLVVVDESMKVQGILSSWDIIQHIVPDYLEEDRHLAAFESGDTLPARVKQLAEVPVSNFMSNNVRTIGTDATLMEAAIMLSEFHIRQLPVVDANGILVGYLNRTDLKLEIGKILGL